MKLFQAQFEANFALVAAELGLSVLDENDVKEEIESNYEEDNQFENNNSNYSVGTNISSVRTGPTPSNSLISRQDQRRS